jgi:hypothetical protein
MGNERYITTLPLFKSQTIAGGTCGTAGPFDLRDIAKDGQFGLTYTIEASGVSSCGTTSFIVHGSPVWDGTYTAMTAGTLSTHAGTNGGNVFIPVTIYTIPFIKIYATMGTSADHVLTGKVTAHLHVR